jgi:hypothetical protein
MEEQENTAGFSFYTRNLWSLTDKANKFRVLLEQLLTRFDWKDGYVKITIEFHPEEEKDD